jgi:hypothetical protein
VAEIPAGSFTGQARLELAPGAPAGPPLAPARSLGRAFGLRVLEWLQGSGTAQNRVQANGEAFLLDLPAALSVSYAGADLRHLDAAGLLLHYWDPQARAWQPLPTAVDEAEQTVYAATERLGNFDLQAPLICPADNLEPDDSFYAATYVEPGRGAVRRLFDVAEDEDWFRFDVTKRPYRIRLFDVADGVAPRMQLYDVDGLTLLAEWASAGAADLEQLWQPDEEGTYFVRVLPASGATGCEAAYTFAIE